MAKLRNRLLGASSLAAFLTVAAATPAVFGQSDVCYSGGPTLSNFKLNGSAVLNGTSIVVTPGTAGGHNGSVMYQTRFSTAASFHFKMQVRITTPGTSPGGPADGMAFVMHNDPAGINALGGTGRGIGYGTNDLPGITPSLTVEFDTFRNNDANNGNENDPAGPHIALTRNGNPDHGAGINNGLVPVLFSSLLPANALTVGTPFFIWIDYTVGTTTLQVFVSPDDTTKPTTATLQTTLNLANALGASFLVGFTASTGGSWSQHEIVQLYATDNGPQANAGCCAKNADCTNPALAICDPQKHTCGACTFSDSTSCTTGDMACNLNGSHNTCSVPCTGNFGTAVTGTNTAPCTSATFPVCRTSGIGAGSCSACSGDFGSITSGTNTTRCGAGAPFCSDSGYCGLCTTNASCAAAGAAHTGMVCNTTSGRCVGVCTVLTELADCGPGNACLNLLCVAKAPNNDPVPGGTCTVPLGTRLCVSAVCNEMDDKCGYPSGGPCTAVNGATVCRSAVCSMGDACIPAASGACYVDADCASGFFCNRTAFMCVAKLANGTAIPNNDGIRNGMCTVPVATAVCQSGLCNATTNTCGGPLGATCATMADCAINICGADLKCGHPDGEGPCTAQNAATVCRSGVCKNMVCVPSTPNACTVDADCDSARFCGFDALTCKPKLLSGVPIPNDGLHNGKCSTVNGMAVCSTGLCNAATDTCGDPIRTECTDPKTCANNICGTNSKCGFVDGSGTCTGATAVVVCQSGVCGTGSGKCIPAGTGGCATDSDCGSTEFCDGKLLHCQTKLPAGTALPDDGVHNTCTTGSNSACKTTLCNATAKTCGAPNGDMCTDAKECAVNICGNNSKCGLNDGQTGCSATTTALCQSGMCSASGVCGAMGCAKDADCGATAYCNGKTGLCAAKLANGQSIPNDGIHDGNCTVPVGAAVCVSSACNVMTKQCAAPLGAPCTAGMSCADGICGNNGKCGRGDGEGPCTAATQTTVCQSMMCNAASMVCQPVGAGRCTVDSDCPSTQYCAFGTLTCAPKVDNGLPIPSDGLHDGTCSNAAAVCVSAMCNQMSTTCGAPNNDPCARMDECASNICPADHICGRMDGLNCLTVAECRSGLCTNGVCGAGPAPASVGGSGGCGYGGGARPAHPTTAGLLGGAGLLLLGLVARRRRRRG